MTGQKTAERLVRRILTDAKTAERLARRNRPFGPKAEAVTTTLLELEKLSKLSVKAREGLAKRLAAQGATMRHAMILGGLLGNTARTLRAGPKPPPKARAARLPIPAPAPAP